MRRLILILTAMLGLGACVNANGERMFADTDVSGFSELLADSAVQILDVRTLEEYAEGHISGAVNIDIYRDDFTNQAVKSLVKSKPVAVYCRSGKRSAQAAKKLAEQGYNVTNLQGGILAWLRKDKPVEKSTH